jgi:formylglycine-generating enzyme required for sulfatase activity
VRIQQRFAIATTEVTRQAASRGPSLIIPDSNVVKTQDSPETAFSWYTAAQYCNWLSKQEGIPDAHWCYEPNEEGKYAPGMKAKANYLELHGYRLPTEGEWEYACRAGTITSRYYGIAESLLPEYAWCLSNAQDRTWPVMSLKPNDLGLFDMLGNALEWCHDRYYGRPPAVPKAEEVLSDTYLRVLRGGAFYDRPVLVRSANRLDNRPGYRNDNNGFRPARTYP